MTENKEKIAIFGGSFNPVHNGHINLVKKINEKFDFDKIIVIPSKNPPHKILEGNATDFDRFKMCQIAFSHLKNVEISDFELKNSGTSYSYITLDFFQKNNPFSQIYFIMGGDMFLYFEHWKNYQFIYNNSIILSAARNDFEYQSLIEYKKNMNFSNAEIIKFKPMEISSTKIREKIKKNQNFSCFLPENVVKYITDNKLYF